MRKNKIVVGVNKLWKQFSNNKLKTIQYFYRQAIS